ncbi:MAG TPA: alpha/beta fold hydrolase [Candidatus Acidoferrum sp.]|nr:alpha/beta fold hydrolase [Candidatus Acidoferrum sp.]
MAIPFDDLRSDPAIHGWLHVPARPTGKSIVLTHGAGADCQSNLLVTTSDALSEAGFTVLRFDLPFRRARPHGPPSPGRASLDRDGLRRAVSILRERKHTQVFLGGHSYGGRQATILVSEQPPLVDGLLLLSYPLHPPRKPNELRTAHFPKLTTPVFFVHGTRDPFGTIMEMNSALHLIPAAHALFEVPGAGHELFAKKNATELLTHVVTEFATFLSTLSKQTKPS